MDSPSYERIQELSRILGHEISSAKALEINKQLTKQREFDCEDPRLYYVHRDYSGEKMLKTSIHGKSLVKQASLKRCESKT
jgi:hypothetical protein